MSLEPVAGEPLQFDTARPAHQPDATTAQGVTCVVCRQTIDDEYYDVNGESTCDRCRQRLTHHAETPKGVAVLAKAGAYGVGAAILGAILYYAVIAITDFEIGIVAIAIGYMVGYAVKLALGSRGGRRFQVMAILLTYWAVGLAYTPLVFTQMRDNSTNGSPTSTAAPAAPSTSAPTEIALRQETASAEPLGASGFMLGVGALLLFSLALPVFVVAGSLPGGLISAAIIAFGMQKAWQMTGAPSLAVSGPYRIARSEAS